MPNPDRGKLTKAAKAARSGLRRYPKQILESIRDPRARKAPSPDGALPSMGGHELAATWLGHATALLTIGGRRVLTDPVFSHRIGMRMGGVTMGLSRTAPPPVEPEALPPIDLILVSHAHFDHLDKPTLERLAFRDTVLITSHRTRRLIPPGYRHVIELTWDKTVRVGGLAITAIRPAHWGARTAVDRNRGFNAYVIESDSHRVLFAGDTADTEVFDSLEHIRLAIFGIGAYEPWEHAHATPEQVWAMFQRVGADYLMPVHHSTFPLSDEHDDEPLERLERAAGDRAERIVCRQIGEKWHL